MDEVDLLAYAETMAARLRQDMSWQQSEYGGGFWSANSTDLLPTIRARAVGAIHFMSLYAGPESHWTRSAREVVASKGENQSTESGCRYVGDILLEWVEQVRAGVAHLQRQAWDDVQIAETDLLGQVRRLLDDRDSHPAAAIVLCGAALEIATRATCTEHGINIEERGGLMANVRALRTAGLLTAQDVKDFEQCAGLRNEAAHGRFDALSVERAGLMEQQTNWLLRRLSDQQPQFEQSEP